MKKLLLGMSALAFLAACKVEDAGLSLDKDPGQIGGGIDNGGGNGGGGGGGGGGGTPPVKDKYVGDIFVREGVDADLITRISNERRPVDQVALKNFVESDEYLKNPAMQSANMAPRIVSGLTGKGVSVAVLDSGVDFTNPNLAGVTFGGRMAGTTGESKDTEGNSGMRRHGTAVAQIIAGTPGDSNHARGIAPGVTLHDVRIMREGSDEYAVSDPFGAALKYIADNRIRIVNGSIASSSDIVVTNPAHAAGQYFQTSWLSQISRATANGTVFVFAVGNDGTASPRNVLPALGLLDVGKGHVIAVASLKNTGDELADNSSKCGLMKDYCLAAVGVRIPVVNTNGSVGNFSGTSAAAPVVTAALAILQEQFPEVSTVNLIELVLATARDAGAPGVDAIFGRGILDLERALAPVGQMAVATGTQLGNTIALDESVVVLNSAGAGFTDVLASSDIMALDGFNRGFQVDGDSLYQHVEDEAPFFTTTLEVETELGTLRMDDDGGFMLRGPVTIGHGSTEFALANGQFFDRGYGQGYGASDESILLGGRYDGTSLLLSFDEGRSKRLDLTYDIALHGGMLRLGAGYMQEDGHLLGSDIVRGNADTVALSAEYKGILTEEWRVRAGMTASHTKLDNGINYFVSGDVTALSAQLALDYRTEDQGTFTFALGAPMTVTGGRIHSDIPVGRGISDGNQDNTDVLRDQFSTDLGGGKQIFDLGLGWEQSFGRGLSSEVKASWRFDDRLDRDDRLSLGFAINWRF